MIVTRKQIKRRAKQRAEKIAAVMRKFDGFGARALQLHLQNDRDAVPGLIFEFNI